MISEAISQATDPMLLHTDWSANLEICDLITSTPDGAVTASQALRKRLKNDNNRVLSLTLELIDACIKNCSSEMHAAVASNDFMADVVALTDGKHGWEVREQALKFVQAWAIEFKDRSGPYVVFTETYARLRTKGVTFPEPEHTAPVFMEEPSEPIEPADATTKLAEDLLVVAEKIKLCREMLPESPGIETDDALAEVVGFLEACKPRMVDLIECGMQGMLGEDLVSQTLQINDDLLKTLEAEKEGTPIAVETSPSVDPQPHKAAEAQGGDLLSFNSLESEAEPDLRSTTRKKKLGAVPIVANDDLLALSTLTPAPIPGSSSPPVFPSAVTTTSPPDIFSANTISPSLPTEAVPVPPTLVPAQKSDPLEDVFQASPAQSNAALSPPAPSPFDELGGPAPKTVPDSANPFEDLDLLSTPRQDPSAAAVSGGIGLLPPPPAGPNASSKTNII